MKIRDEMIFTMILLSALSPQHYPLLLLLPHPASLLLPAPLTGFGNPFSPPESSPSLSFPSALFFMWFDMALETIQTDSIV